MRTHHHAVEYKGLFGIDVTVLCVHFYLVYLVIFELTWIECNTAATIKTLGRMDRRAVYLAIMLGFYSLSLNTKE